MENPCVPSPCGPNSQCRVVGSHSACSCLPNYIGRPPNCRPECVINAECASNLACRNERCTDPCPGSCGSNAKCTVVNHNPMCTCFPGYSGDATRGCNLTPAPSQIEYKEILNPCNPSPCGLNAICKERNGAGSCTCIPEFIGDPYKGCSPECESNSQCSQHLACVGNKCRDPCEGVCGVYAQCRAMNHIPSCYCAAGFTGDPHKYCYHITQTTAASIVNVCSPTPCGPNSNCRTMNGLAVCTCLPSCIGQPPNCRFECLTSQECAANLACIDKKCVDPCPSTCTSTASCRVVNHQPFCNCQYGFTGDGFKQCVPITTTQRPEVTCEQSLCGPNSECRIINNLYPACTCLSGFTGRPPNCRPECTHDSDCPNNKACHSLKCTDPCYNYCGLNTRCNVVNHTPVCTCQYGFVGDSNNACKLQMTTTEKSPPPDPCFPSPCGTNAECRERNGAGACYCLQGFFGDPYTVCKRECEVNSDCPKIRACSSYKCIDPCPGTCGQDARCEVINHVPTCNCPAGYTGDPFSVCRPIPVTEPPIRRHEPCSPSPCGPNSQCRVVNLQAVCSCLPNYVGSPPACRPECVVSSECPADKACINQKCRDPCPNTCGIGAHCTVKNHNPICACPASFTGDPFIRCSPIPIVFEPEPTERPPSCVPSPCGPHSQCHIKGNVPACSCLPGYIGSPPSCRPECVLSAECASQLACINQKCRDPCPGSCGINAKCHVVNHTPICTCEVDYTGDAFTQCVYIDKEPVKAPKIEPCNPSPCGPNAICNVRNEAAYCECIPEYTGNPYESCRPECVLNAECDRSKACLRNKCKDPCPGTCGQNARCDVINHIPVCSCPEDYTGDPFTHCRPADKEPIVRRDLCSPSPCGPNSQCREINGQAVCSCLVGYEGSPPSCRPECVVSSECPSNKACVNNKCIDPCRGSCGVNARCEVINHSPICSCRQGQTGDPFRSCYDIPPPPIAPVDRGDLCVPNPCGPNSECRGIDNTPSCSCLFGYQGAPPNCRPECIISPDCPSTQACVNQKCRDPCPGSCGANAECRVVNHAITCTCIPEHYGNPFEQCLLRRKEEILNPCQPSPCGVNAECKQRNGAGACTCIPDYFGNPYEGCRPECVLSSDCPTDRACIKNKCQNPCPGICGQNAVCNVLNHVPTCYCIEGYIGDPFTACRERPPPPRTPEPISDPCQPSPCGPNSQCRQINGQAVCSCQPNYEGSPPNCRPECVVSSECPSNRACTNYKCRDPCPGTCGLNARCEVINHNPICSCPAGHTGDPFTRCYREPVTPPPTVVSRPDPCHPSHCGPNSICENVHESARCSCLPNYVGLPPSCRPECVVNTECASQQACITEKCRDPCPGSCGINAECRVQNHIPICTCMHGHTGDPFTQCNRIIEPVVIEKKDPCNPSPCGANADCNDGLCTCIRNYFGDPYVSCRPECVLNSDCDRTKACSSQRCIDPCPGTCGQGARCDVINHIPTCSCPEGTTGDPFSLLRREVCSPSPCGPNSQCREVNNVAVCSCLPGYIGSPPSCRPECVVSAECPLQQACLNQKCRDPCPGTCGQNARCQVVNHNPICSCAAGHTGDPFTRCYAVPVRGDSPACVCLKNYIGAPPNCRPECVINPECASHLACVNQRCQDPCAGACGANARCRVVNHTPMCTCDVGYTGDPFSYCVLRPEPVVAEKLSPCEPSPCGANAICREQNSAGACTCLPEHIGNPYEGCRPECVHNSDCASTKACTLNKCKDPCPGTCGPNAECQVVNHLPSCSCRPGYTGDPFRHCSLQPTA
ncbi:hypothetical protein B566_EDAN018173, partial [Ephemera danica]